MVDEPGEVEAPTWRIRAGVSLVEFAPLSEERRAIIAREAAKEARAAELEEQLRADRDLERAAELRRQGHELHSVADRLAQVSFAQDRGNAAERRREREAAEQLGQPEPRTTPVGVETGAAGGGGQGFDRARVES